MRVCMPLVCFKASVVAMLMPTAIFVARIITPQVPSLAPASAIISTLCPDKVNIHFTHAAHPSDLSPRLHNCLAGASRLHTGTIAPFSTLSASRTAVSAHWPWPSTSSLPDLLWSGLLWSESPAYRPGTGCSRRLWELQSHCSRRCFHSGHCRSHLLVFPSHPRRRPRTGRQPCS
ncbi:hypothetical protein BU23DRAFT_28946 [Bimuria novae-zelandiae CBS 107.79]|uniref:Uncharacterized protein n=1 Tax=Bimuria novae-zelandiae CBS 107.79 TaxID=1447943 RepID=A0A6A5VIS8_9PLEO|nr:hypothetical protein BU23DRAFT_28946 [Bimuria novae-zelandiae CBS 107.79]